MKYRPEIDGLRAVAVLPVILFHAGYSVFSGGFVGVDVFFVISGYLITGIILAEIVDGKFSISGFYERRARRILPALFLVMAACLPFAWHWLLPQELKNFSQSLVAVSLFSSNFLFWLTSDYFDTASEFKPLLHTWSLAVEEQYYLLFPIFLYFAWRLGRRWLLGILLCIALASLAAAHRIAPIEPPLAFYLPVTRVWELLLGSMVAIVAADQRHLELGAGWRQALGWAGAGLLVGSMLVFDKQTPFPSLFTLAPTIGTALLILFATADMPVGRALRTRLLVGVGLISYSAYLWHHPLFAFARHRSLSEPSAPVYGGLALLSVALAYLSWRYVEKPFRTKGNFTRRQIFALAGAGSLVFMAVGLAGHLGKGYPQRMPDTLNLPEAELPKIDNGWCFYSIDTIGSLRPGEPGLNCWLGDRGSASKAILFGDSFAGQYEPLWDAVGRASNIAVNAVTTNWCHPSIGKDFSGPVGSRAYPQCLFNRRHLVDNIARYDAVILSGDWGAILHQKKLAGALDLVAYAAPRTKVVVLMPAPRQFDVDVLAFYKKGLLFGERFDIAAVPTTKDHDALAANAILEATARRYDNVVYLGRDALFSLNGAPSDLTASGRPFSWDGAHISIHGAREAARAFLASAEFAELEKALKGATRLTSNQASR